MTSQATAKGPPPSQVAGCLFCKIIRGEIAAHIVDDGPSLLVFLDHRPLFPGHCLVVTRAHHETLLDVPKGSLGELFAEVQRVAGALERGLGAEGTFVAVNNRVSQSVPHLHVHVVPRRRKDGLKGFFWPRQHYESEEAAHAICESIRAALL
jgi:histidine triad (HIT) family protein